MTVTELSLQLGKTYSAAEFNAAVPYMRNKGGVKSLELYKFDTKVGTE